ncbi:ADP-glyceromanno-heptose 6-epimerase [Candidatus Woesearchaeota archaeon CG10_big_fil_rev_8_21_14_0_10_44_13]|nr:MAG: ADP-glyceromanno-heptose 6-epimerase [Candidatus Woesearchaeota archaeon CG10_big_fil_rev_8_21_14_0_10_44_13]
MIILTGGAGFIGSCMVKELNNRKIQDIIIVDDVKEMSNCKNLATLKYKDFVDKSQLTGLLNSSENIDLVIHMGACTSTTETNGDYLMKNNFYFSKEIYDWCANNNCRLIYASSAATYGDGSLGYDDSLTEQLKPLNIYGETKRLFDQYVLSSKKKPPQWIGLRFFNVYGPNEYHKGSMASVIFHSFNQIKKQGKVNLFKSYKPGVNDGEQKRDFVYVKDVLSVIMFMIDNKAINGIFNIGTGEARTFNDLAKSVFNSLGLDPKIDYVDMPNGLAEKYQYSTQADIVKLRQAGYKQDFYSLELGVMDYVLNYLNKGFLNY